MDFFRIATKETRGGIIEISPDFTVGRSKDLMVRGSAFYAIWNEALGLWSKDEYDVPALVDRELNEHADKLREQGISCTVRTLTSFDSNRWKQFKAFMKSVSDNSRTLDAKVMFASTPIKRNDYASRRLNYDMAEGSIAAYEELVNLLYIPEERAKFEWAIGAIIAGDAKKIEKMLVFFGAPGTGKSTVMNLAIKLLGGLVDAGGYVSTFDCSALVNGGATFATDAFRDEPLLSVDQDTDLSGIRDNSTLNSIISKEVIRVNEKFKPTYDLLIQSFLFVGTNKPVRFSDAKNGLIRRIIDVNPTGETHNVNRYRTLVQLMDFELGAIAHHCLNVYREMGKNYYNDYKPVSMMLQTDVFFNFVEAHFDIFKAQDGTTLKQAYALYKQYCTDSELDKILPQYKFRDELKNYFSEFIDRAHVDGADVRSLYKGFTAQPFKVPLKSNPKAFSLVLEETTSVFDKIYADLPAQYAKADETPSQKWENVTTTLADLDTSRMHYVKLPENHIVIDFDLKGEDGSKSLELNLEAASDWPATYAELSKSGSGVHLHYEYTGGDAGNLASLYSEGIEIKVFRGGSSLRRKLSRSNAVPVASISSGLPFKEKKPVIDAKTLQSEKGLRELIERNLRKEIHPGTKPSVEFILKILDDVHKSGMPYDVTDMRGKILTFANNSTNNAPLCLKAVQKMKFKSEDATEDIPNTKNGVGVPIVIFDCEVFPNFFGICWKYKGDAEGVRMINPTPAEVERLFEFRLIGFNNREYDNHILWGRMLGYTNRELYLLSKKILAKDRDAMFGEAYSASYADVHDYATKKQSLKKWEIELGIHHMELDLPWDEDVPDDRVEDVMDYCMNDVIALEAVIDHCDADFLSRQILAEMSGLTVNHPTRKHAERIVFGNDKNPQKDFVYTDLSEMFPGYEFDPYAKIDKSTYRGEAVGEGGYVYAEPGMYENVALLDVASMHPTSIIELNLFGPYTEKFANLYHGRLAIKGAMHAWKKGWDDQAARLINEASQHLPGLTVTKNNAAALSDALKLVLNSVYGYTAATFPNLFRDLRNKDNIVAKRGALFMVDLKNYIQSLGYQVVHIKTDSVKIPNADDKIIELVMEFGRRYGYDFEHEKTFEKLCLVNDAVYIAKMQEPDQKTGQIWTATGAEFAHPVVFKALFSGEEIKFDDLCETKSVKAGVMYLDFGDGESTPAAPRKGLYHVGRVGRFVPVYRSGGGGRLLRIKDDRSYAVTGTKDYLWLEAEMVKDREGGLIGKFKDVMESPMTNGSFIDMGYYEDLVFEAQQTIEKFTDYAEFVK